MILETAALVALVSVPAAAAVRAGFLSWRGRRRNQRDLCADCAGPHYAAPAYDAPALVQGRTVCGPCAARHRRRLRVALGLVAVLTGTAVVGGVAAAAMGAIGWGLPALLAAEYAAVFGGALAWMKRRNRQAHQELLAGTGAAPRLTSGAGTAASAR
ncbi:hypothetical protein [Longimicrobium sp.]|jgi:hypothetical protein|uniref:hypothetical protein n=1 Tax=Longimicrobium sp. TaxID=2029185 RepID=UPI002ED7727A